MIWFPGRWTDANSYIRAERANKRKAATIKRDETVAAYLLALSAKQPVTAFPIALHFTWHAKDRRRDLDNMAFAAKAIIDGMVQAGVFPNDTPKYITRIIHDFVIDPNEGVMVEIEGIE